MRVLFLAALIAQASTAKADELTDWMCLFENVPMEVIDPSSMISEKKMRVTITNNLGFALNKVAVDFSLSSETSLARFEDNIVFPFPAPLQPGETREIVAYFTMTEAELTAMDHPDLSATAAIANALDQNDRRVVLRENLGPSFEVFWPFQLKSSKTCTQGAQ